MRAGPLRSDLGTLNGNNEPVLSGININQRKHTPTFGIEDIPHLPGAVCKGVDDDGAFFPKTRGTVATEAAKAICQGCPVVKECLDYALAWENRTGEKVYGVWGGLDEWDRTELRDKSAARLCRKRLHEVSGDNAEAVPHAPGTFRCRACRLAAKSAYRERKKKVQDG